MSAARIWALVSGLPPRLRANRVLVFLQAFIDDSVAERGDGRLYMAGYINTVESWAKFSADWDAALKREPAIEYLSMKEAHSVRGPFRGWSDPKRDLKLAKLARVIRRYKSDTFQYTIDRSEYLDKVKPAAPRNLGSAHYVCTFGIVAMITRYLEERNFTGKVDFIFDQQSGVSADIPLFFEYMTRNLSKAQRAMIARTPQFGDKRDFLPLQAADMLAWHLRREYESGDVADRLRKILPENSAHLSTHVPSEMLRIWQEGMSQIRGASKIQSKADWRKFKGELGTALAKGYIPPRGSRWRNFLFEIEQRIRFWFLKRRRRP